MTDEPPIFETLEPPPGGLVGLRQKLEPRPRAWAVKALPLALIAAALVALFVVPALTHRAPRTLVIQYTAAAPSAEQSAEVDAQIALLDLNGRTRSQETVSVRADQASTTQVTAVFESSKTSFYLVAALSWP